MLRSPLQKLGPPFGTGPPFKFKNSMIHTFDGGTWTARSPLLQGGAHPGGAFCFAQWLHQSRPLLMGGTSPTTTTFKCFVITGEISKQTTPSRRKMYHVTGNHVYCYLIHIAASQNVEINHTTFPLQTEPSTRFVGISHTARSQYLLISKGRKFHKSWTCL